MEGYGGWCEGLNKFHWAIQIFTHDLELADLLTERALTTQFADLADIPGLHNITTGRCL